MNDIPIHTIHTNGTLLIHRDFFWIFLVCFSYKFYIINVENEIFIMMGEFTPFPIFNPCSFLSNQEYIYYNSISLDLGFIL